MRILHYAVPLRTRRISVRDEHIGVRDGSYAEEFFEQDAALVVGFGVGGGGGGEAFEGDGILGLELRSQRCVAFLKECFRCRDRSTEYIYQNRTQGSTHGPEEGMLTAEVRT